MLWITADGTAIFEPPQPRRIIGFVPESNRVITWNTNQTALERWSAEDDRAHGVPLAGMGPEPGAFTRWGFSPDYRMFFAIDQAGQVHFWDTVNGQDLGALQGPAPPIRAATLGRGGSHLAISVQPENFARVYHCSSGGETRLVGHRDYVSGVAFSHDGATIATGSIDGTIRLWEVATG